MSLTAAQKRAVEARGNVLVVAGAGTGKTHTLVERCLGCLLEERPRASLDEILMVTFTEAAAAEMRQRIRGRLEEEFARDPADSHWQEQLALFETAHIGTLHSFCLKLVREHFYELGLDPQLSVLAEEEARLLADETLDTVLQRHYAGRGPMAAAVQDLIQSQGRGWDKPIRSLVLRLHHFTQTLPDPGAWLEGQLAGFASPAPADWERWLVEAVGEWCDHWRPALESLPSGNEVAARCARALPAGEVVTSRAAVGTVLDALSAAAKECPTGKKGAWLEPLKAFLEEARFLSSLARSNAASDPLGEDWAWVRGQMGALLGLAVEFTRDFSEAKHELGMVDFHDLEQHALRLLWDRPAGAQPSRIARQWREKLRFVFVDEYQDINAAQDRIIQALSREGEQANRFLVGDVKQSIYRFRLANPRIFQEYVRSWGGGQGVAIPLVENFRSREGVLNFINSVFTTVMRAEAGGVAYDERAQLVFGAAPAQPERGAEAGSSPHVELHLRVKSSPGQREDADQKPGAPDALQDLEAADKEARIVALRLRALYASRREVWDENARAFRPLEWRDLAILLRSPAGKVESYAKEFARLEIPLQVARGGFYQSLEISDLVNLLRMLDNPLQDIPVLAVLHSPLAGLTLNELAAIRLTVIKTHFWTALLRWSERGQRTEAETYEKVRLFLERFTRWRRLARQVSLSRCLEAVLTETRYADWLLTQPRGEQRQSNVQRLAGLAEQFDQFQRQGLFRFLRFIEAQQAADAEPQVAAVSGQNAVRLMSIHQSKGLEFPVVVVADLGKAFNLADLRAEIILDERYGLCPQVKPPHTGQRYPSLPYWLACRRQIRELLGEETRLLYVALTRARDTLILSGTISAAKLNGIWKNTEEPALDAILSARSFADWLGLWFARNGGMTDGESRGENRFLRWFMHDDASLAGPAADGCGAATEPTDRPAVEPEVWRGLEQRLSWQYPFVSATKRPAKASVSELRRRASEVAEEGDEFFFRAATPGAGVAPMSAEAGVGAAPAGQGTKPGSRLRAGRGSVPGGIPAPTGQPLGAAELGVLHHVFLQRASLSQTGSQAALVEEARRLESEGVLRAEEIAQLDFAAVAAFWDSALGRTIRAQAPFVQRELAFTARFEPKELAALTGEPADPSLDGEYVVVQGVADLVVLLPEEIWLVDFKTDAIASGELADRARLYGPQVRLYAGALSRIYRRPAAQCWLYFLACSQGVLVEGARRE